LHITRQAQCKKIWSVDKGAVASAVDDHELEDDKNLDKYFGGRGRYGESLVKIWQYGEAMRAGRRAWSA
jgi:hypothetical protein